VTSRGQKILTCGFRWPYEHRPRDTAYAQ